MSSTQGFYKGFTLAEVLITLGIIGVIAALVLSNLVQTHRRKVYEARNKKFMNTMSNAISTAQHDLGGIDEWFPHKIKGSGAHTKEFFDTYLAPYLNVVKVNYPSKINSDVKSHMIDVYLNDGSMFTIHNGDCFDIKFHPSGKIKTHTEKNMLTFFVATEERRRKQYCGNENIAFCPLYTWTSEVQIKTREKALDYCKKDSGLCTQLLIFDNWEYRKDYPHRL